MKTVKLDCVGLFCPMPLVRIKRTMDGLDEGDCLKVVASDPAFEADIKAWTQRFGHTLIELDVAQQVTALLRKVA